MHGTTFCHAREAHRRHLWRLLRCRARALGTCSCALSRSPHRRGLSVARTWRVPGDLPRRDWPSYFQKTGENTAQCVCGSSVSSTGRMRARLLRAGVAWPFVVRRISVAEAGLRSKPKARGEATSARRLRRKSHMGLRAQIRVLRASVLRHIVGWLCRKGRPDARQKTEALSS